MVSARLYGGLGNQLFQYAVAIAYAKLYDMPYCIPISTTDEKKWKSYRIGKVNYAKPPKNKVYQYREKGFEYTQLDKVPNAPNVLFSGHFNSYRYFDFMLPELRDIFNFPYYYNECVSIHVRRGDYLSKEFAEKFNVVTDTYLKSAIDYFVDYMQGLYPVKFKFFSDDIAWCKDFVARTTLDKEKDYVEFTFSENKTEVEDLAEMSSCAHNIIANSTFSIWGALLNPNQNKIVVCPHEDSHFGKLKKDLITKDIYPSEWVRIKY